MTDGLFAEIESFLAAGGERGPERAAPPPIMRAMPEHPHQPIRDGSIVYHDNGYDEPPDLLYEWCRLEDMQGNIFWVQGQSRE